MTKIIKIDTCSACPYKLMTPDFKRKCRIFGYKIIDVPITTIPYWCPLEDAVLTSAIHSDGESSEVERFNHYLDSDPRLDGETV